MREINKDRLKKGINPLLVIPIDSTQSADMAELESIETTTDNLTISEECLASERSLIQDMGRFFWLASYNREEATANNFLEELKSMNEEDKGIIFYHQGHLFKKAKACIPKFEDDFIDVSPRYGSWLQIALSQVKVDIKVNAIDHEAIEDYISPNSFYEGVMTPEANYINKLYHIFYTPGMFDDIINLSGSSFKWLDQVENRFSKNVTCW